MSDVAELAGVGKGTLYLYFPSKEDLLISILQEYVDEALAFTEQLAKQGVETRRSIELFFERGLAQIADNPAFFMLMEQRVFLSNPELRRRGEEFFRSIIGRIVEKLEAVIERGYIRGYDSTIVACALIGTLSSVQFYHVLNPEVDLRELMPRFARELARFITAGLEPEQAPAHPSTG
jgi:TetR/AcrR family fatty acid metabolism transcriptional regulator